ncbi:MAG TPA: CopD family protein [Stellaceae bacterium]|nr:CopD family protein [Stellaceae bacterium]
MQTLMTLMRALHFASLLSLAGSLVFAAFAAEPALRKHLDGGGMTAFRTRLFRLIWTSLALGVFSGLLWLIMEARSVSGRSLAVVFSENICGTVLDTTDFGKIWAERGYLALLLTLCLVLAGGRRGSASAAFGFWTALGLGAVELVMIANVGHAAAETGRLGYLYLGSDMVHMLAASAWVGGLVPLVLFFAAARRSDGGACAAAAREVTGRFTLMGMLAIGVILLTGMIDTLSLVGSVPALLGSDYGHLLLLKAALFSIMVAFAAVNRRWSTSLPAELSRSAAAGTASPLLRRLQRNALAEAGLGGVLLLVLGALGTTQPALHVQPHWPLPFRLSLATIETAPRAQIETIIAGALALCGLALFGHGLFWPRRRTIQTFGGLFLFLAVVWWPLRLMAVTAYPTSFYQSPVPFTAPSIARGARLYADNCTACHGAGGRGDGPLSKSTAVAPADLTAAHIFAHSDGDLFWWIGEGIPAGGMPGFAAIVDERGRWDLINFIHTRASAQPLALLPEVTPGPAPPAPDFIFERGGKWATLRQTFTKTPLLLVFYRLPDSLPRLRRLASSESRLASAGLGLLAVPADAAAEDAEDPTDLPDFAAATGADTAGAYALFDNGSGPCEFLIDRAGFLRARWMAEPADTAALLAQLDRLAQLPLQEQQPHVHVHAH